MCSRQPSARHQRGVTLIELMVGVAIGLLASLAVAQVLVASEGQKRTTSSASEAQVNGALALGALRRALMSAGYGFAASRDVLGCALATRFNGVPVANMPEVMAPVFIDQGAGDAPDTVRVLASGKRSYSVPIRVVAPYKPGTTSFEVGSVLGAEGPVLGAGGAQTAPGDLMVAAINGETACEMFQVTGAPAGTTLPRGDAPGGWNPVGWPAGEYGVGAVLLNLGRPMDVTYSLAGNSLRVSTLDIAADGAPSYENTELFPDIVNLQALYGKDTNVPPDGTVDVWNTDTPTNAAGWRQVVAVRVALVARSTQLEREEVTSANPQWDVGTAIEIAGTAACGNSACLTLKVDHLAEWKRYRYRVFDTVVPLRNMLWAS